VAGDAVEAGGSEGGSVVGELGGTQAGEEAEGEVEGADQEAGGEAEDAGWDAEVGEEPESPGLKVGGEAVDESFEAGLGEAVEEEVGDYEVVGLGGLEGEGAGLVGLDTGGVGDAAGFEEVQHGAAGVDCVSVQRGIGGEQLG
jgi:hypothetical protein